MNLVKKNLFRGLVLAVVAVAFASAAYSQKTTVLAGAALTKVVPTSFYFAGQSAQTQMRNAAAAQFGAERFFIAGMVDTSGYSTEISGKYEGFFIVDFPVSVGGKRLDIGAYGFGFSADNQIHIFDLSAKEILASPTKNDSNMKRPRPLMMTSEGSTVRFYKGKSYVVVGPATS
jgi:hypothetical protein